MANEVKRPPRDVTIPSEDELDLVSQARQHLDEAIGLLASISENRPSGDFPDARTAIVKANAARGYCDDLLNLVKSDE